MVKPIKKRTKTSVLVNPQTSSGAKRQSANPGELIALGWLNPQQRRHTVPATKKKSKGKGQTKKHKAAKPRPHNPALQLVPFIHAGKKHNALEGLALINAARSYGHKGKKKKRNPDAAKLLQKPVDALRFGGLGLAGLVATRYLPQIALASYNKGVVGYAANLAVAVATGAVAGATIGVPEGFAVFIGGSLYLVNRIFTDLTPLGRQLNLSGIGDVHAAGDLGALVSAYFPVPVVKTRDGRPVIPAAIIEAVLRQIPPAPAATATGPGAVSGLSRFHRGL
jgi:hypothetical protein